MEISHCSCSGQGGSQGFLVILNSGRSSELAVKAQDFTLGPSHHHLFDPELGIYFPICRPALQARCRLQPRVQTGKNKIFYSGRICNKAQSSWGWMRAFKPSTRHLKYFKTGADHCVKSSQSPIYICTAFCSEYLLKYLRGAKSSDSSRAS